MKISIVLCTFNGEKYLNDLLDSLSSQSKVPDELIICDDGSTDNTVSIINNFKTKVVFSVKLFVNETRLGSTKNFEKAIKLSSGDFVFLCDQDDVWHQDKIKTIIKEFEIKALAGAVFSNASVVDEKLNPLGYNLWESIGFKSNQFLDENIPATFLLNHSVVTGATMAFKKEFKDLIQPIPETWVHDEWMAFLISVVSKVTFIKEPLIKYRQHGTNQIGAGMTGITAKFLTSDSVSHDFYIKKYKALQKRINAIIKLSEDKDVLYEIANKINHLNNRNSLPSNFISRIRVVVKELVKLRYHRYSNGFVSAGKDLLRK